MALEIQQEETVNAVHAIKIFREILDDPSMKESIFYNLVTDGKIVPISKGVYLRSDVERTARQRLHDMQELSTLLGKSQVLERMKECGITLKEREFDRMVETEQLPAARRFGRYRYFRPEDVEKVIIQLIDINARRASVQGLFETGEAVTWINHRLAEQGRTDRIALATFYKQIEREIIEPDERILYSKQNSSFRYYFSKDTLSNHPIFKAVPVMPDEDIEPVRVTGSKSLRRLEAQWGDLVTRHGIKEEGLSVHAVKGSKTRRIKPVGYDGAVQWFPARYIPPKRKREDPAAKQANKILEDRSQD